MLKKSASCVLASLRGSTYGGKVRLGSRHWALTNSRPSATVTLITLRVADLAAAVLEERRVLARQGWAGEIVGLFEHPAGCVN